MIVGRAQDASGKFHAFVTTLSGGAIALTSLDARADGDFGAALGINSVGDVIGYYTTAGEHMSARNRAFSYRDFAVKDIGTFGAEDGVAVAMNDRGSMAGFSASSLTPTMPSTAPSS
jgi:probable HAF family extracellular repeat protein